MIMPEPMTPRTTSALGILEALHAKCNHTASRTLVPEFEQFIAQGCLLTKDLQGWCLALEQHPGKSLLETAAGESAISTLNVCQGQYRNAFKGLRLTLEITLQYIYLSVDLLSQNEWLKNEKDTVWASLTDSANGPLSSRFCKAFFPELETNVSHYREMSKSLYRELSECIHGNTPKQILLPMSLDFDRDTLLLWHEKVKILQTLLTFSLCLRFLNELTGTAKEYVAESVTECLGHMAVIRKRIRDGGE